MHIIQQKLLRLISEKNIDGMKLREIGEEINETHPQKIKHHLNQLKEKGLIIHNKLKGVVSRLDINNNRTDTLLSIPILGSANCGPANLYSDENYEGCLKISSKLVRNKNKLFAVKAIGNSMNKAKINSKAIKEGDYVIVDSENTSPNNGDYVLTILDGVCNIKKFSQNKKAGHIILTSESSQEYPPIIIHLNEVDSFINGKVVDVIKI